jgi:hypothetical protein
MIVGSARIVTGRVVSEADKVARKVSDCDALNEKSVVLAVPDCDMDVGETI